MKNLFSLLLWLSPLSGFGQLLYNGDALTIQAGATLTVQGGITHTTGSSVANAGTITLSGDWINNAGNGLLNPATGTVVLNGTATQTIGGSSVTTFHSLDISGTTLSVQMGQDLSVGNNGGVLTLGNRSLWLNQHAITVDNVSSGAITAGTGSLVSETSSPLSPIQWLASGIQTYTYPVSSTAGAAIPLTVQVTQAGTGTNPSLSLATYPTLANNLPWPTGVTTLNGQATTTLDRYWVISADNYTTLPTATVTFSYQDTEWQGSNTIQENNLQLFRWTGTAWQPLVTVVDVVANTLKVVGLSSFGIFTATDSDVPLPLQLLAFQARRLNEKENELNWTTTQEESLAGYQIEKSTDASEFSSIGYVPAIGQYHAQLTYRFLDVQAIESAYYRLKMLDVDGQFTYSKKVFVAFTAGQELRVGLSPNPTAGVLQLRVDNLPTGPLEMSVTDGLGRVLLTRHYEQPLSTLETRLDFSAWTRGIYWVQLRLGSQVIVRRVVLD